MSWRLVSKLSCPFYNILMDISLEQIAEAFLRLRLSQILINEEYKRGEFKVPVHLAMGHEAIAVALNFILQEEDKLILSHRNIAYNLARLGSLRPILHEYLLKDSGLMGGRLGSMNLINPSRGIIYSSSILGNNFPVAVGIAMAHKLRNQPYVTFVLGGDGSIEEGSFYESLLNAKSWGTSLVFVIENNGWSLGTHILERRCSIDLEEFTNSLGIFYLKLGGNHSPEYIEALANVREKSLHENNPVCIEVLVKTLGDRRADDGRYINYHAGPSPVVDVLKHAPEAGILRENEEDPLFVMREELGREKFNQMSRKIMKELQEEIK